MRGSGCKLERGSKRVGEGEGRQLPKEAPAAGLGWAHLPDCSPGQASGGGHGTTGSAASMALLKAP